MQQNEDEWADVVIFDIREILNAAKQLTHAAFLARQRQDHALTSSYVTKALTTISDIEIEFPLAAQALRQSLEKI